MKGVGQDKRIGAAFLNAGIGYGGSCFPKDTTSLLHTANTAGVPFPLLEATVATNELQPKRFVESIVTCMGGVEGRKIAVLGLAFKANTDDMRDAKSIDVILGLQAQGATVSAFDPIAAENCKRYLPDLHYARSAFEAVEGADAVVVVTEWNEFKQINLDKLKATMNGDWLFDGRNLYDPEKVKRTGFQYVGIGRGYKCPNQDKANTQSAA